MFSFNSFVIIWGLIFGFGEATCSSHSDCVTFATLTSDRRYCCGGTFCCTYQQFSSGVTEDPFKSMSIPVIVGIVVGIMAFLTICGVLIYCLLKGARKGPLNRAPKTSRLDIKSESDIRLERSGPRPGRAVPKARKSPDYDYPPDAFSDPEPTKYPSRLTPTAPHKAHTIPTVIGTNDRPWEHEKKRYSSRYAYDGPAAYDSDERYDRHHSKTKDNHERGYGNKDPYRKYERTHDRQYREDRHRDNRRHHHGDGYSYDRHGHKEGYRDERKNRREDYSFKHSYGRDENSHDRRNQYTYDRRYW